jgi:predicted TIM-barrel fold metal-dependent hydrolase
MLTRREVLRLTGAAVIARPPAARAFAAASTVHTAVDFDVPRGACDCHVHVVSDPARFPMAAGRVYTPPTASVNDLLDLQRALHLDRVVIVQPSFYGTDNAAILDAMRQLGPARARGVAVIDDIASSTVLDAMRSAGIRGIRVNLETAGEVDPAVAAGGLRAAIGQSQTRGWHIQLYTRLSVVASLAEHLAASPVPLVFDHFGGAQGAMGASQPGFEALLGLVRSGKAYVKISGAYRASKAGPAYTDVAPLVEALVAANPDRVLWGSDWPHPDSTRLPGRAPTDVTPFLNIDDGVMFNQLPRWIPDAALRRRILVDNPGRLYGF